MKRFLLNPKIAWVALPALSVATFLAYSQTTDSSTPLTPETVEASGSSVVQEGAVVVEVNGRRYETAADCEEPLEAYGKAREIFLEETRAADVQQQLLWGSTSDKNLSENRAELYGKSAYKRDAVTAQVPDKCWSGDLPDPDGQPGVATQMGDWLKNVSNAILGQTTGSQDQDPVETTV